MKNANTQNENEEHQLHRALGNVLSGFKKTPEIEIILAPECSDVKCKNQQKISLFINELENEEVKNQKDSNRKKSRKTAICNVDAMIIKDEKIRIIIEIEEKTAKNPTQICGKYLTSNLAEYYANKGKNGREIDIKKSSVLFIQIVDTKSFDAEKSSKSKQFDNIEKAINNLIQVAKTARLEYGCIKEYKLIKIDGKLLSKDNDKLFEKFKNIIESEINRAQ
ncbi:MAG: hypothetical protein FWB90_06700 [Fibromonadales bacterium]|nr:hypothetical protein [Fibromonadales bacterium]